MLCVLCFNCVSYVVSLRVVVFCGLVSLVFVLCVFCGCCVCVCVCVFVYVCLSCFVSVLVDGCVLVCSYDCVFNSVL